MPWRQHATITISHVKNALIRSCLIPKGDELMSSPPSPASGTRRWNLHIPFPLPDADWSQGERHDADSGGQSGGGVGAGAGGGAMAFVLTDRNSLLRLRERDTPSKLELLFRKNLYPMAISLAHASDHDVSEILGIYRKRNCFTSLFFLPKRTR